MPKFTGSGDYTAEEHIEDFYAYAENIKISEEDVWTRIFVQSLDGQARKWFKELPANSVAGIEHLDEVFLKHWGERRDFLYYINEFGNLSRENGNMSQTSPKDLIRCSARFLQRSSRLMH